MTDWRSITPSPAPTAVTRAMRAIDDVTARLRKEREQLTAAKSAVTQAESADRVAMAQMIRDGGEPQSAEGTITAAKSAVEVAQRRVQAGELALADAQASLGDACRAVRGKWIDKTSDDSVAARERGLHALDQLEQALVDMSSATATAAWLSPNGGLDNAKPPRGGLPTLAASAPASANGSPFAAGQVLDWMRAALVPAPPPAEPPVQHERDAWPAMGARAAAD